MAADGTPMAADISRVELDRITSGIIGAGQKISRVLGVGFLEKVYARMEVQRIVNNF